MVDLFREELANIMECEVTRYMAILELTKGAAVTKGDLDHNPKFNTYPHKFYVSFPKIFNFHHLIFFFF